METLQEFHGHSNNIELQGELFIKKNGILDLNFNWNDRDQSILYPSQNPGRQDLLWQNTCFEAFIQSEAQSSYLEINLSPTGAWNVYQFNNYRSPQPPQPAKSELLEFSFDGRKISAKFLLPKTGAEKFKVSLCSILKIKSNETTYWSTSHEKDKPDFHRHFSLERNII